MTQVINGRILIVEDDAHGQDVAASLLRHYGFEVDITPTGEEGLALTLQRAAQCSPCYNAILIDLSLPGIDGWALLRELQSNPDTAHIPCVAITAYHSANVAREAIQAGFVAFFPKPINIATFVTDLQRYLR